MDLSDIDGMSPLHKTAAGGNLLVLGWLLAKGPDSRLYDECDRCLFHAAAASDKHD